MLTASSVLLLVVDPGRPASSRATLGHSSLAWPLVLGRYNPALSVIPQVGCSASALFMAQCRSIVSFILYAADLV